MKIKTLAPILWTKDLEETILFYTDVLNFKIREKNEGWGWASLYKDEVEIALETQRTYTV